MPNIHNLVLVERTAKTFLSDLERRQVDPYAQECCPACTTASSVKKGA